TEGNVITATDLSPCSGGRQFSLKINTSGLTLIKRDIVPEETGSGDYLCGGGDCWFLDVFQITSILEQPQVEQSFGGCGPAGLQIFNRSSSESVEVSGGEYEINVSVFNQGDTTSTFELISVEAPNVAGDFDGDGDADVDDYNALGNSLGLCASDTNRDSIVDFSDLLMVINDWGTTCDTNP
ncbi:MAG: hypothetical protein VXZ53_07715, partial [Planctomycetota bacterium]|nr:hypothetical protein [Planctomycetota bacterium]